MDTARAKELLGREIGQHFGESGLDRQELRVLDIGCGTGYFPVLLGKEGHGVTGIDLTDEMVLKAKELVKENALYQKRLRF